MKTNKSFSKRLRVTKSGKIIARQSGKDHFNAKKSRRVQINKKRGVNFVLKNKDISHFMPNTK